MAAAVKAALFQFSREPGARCAGNQAGPRTQQWPEWSCQACGTTNWAARPSCRRCGGPKQAGAFASLQEAAPSPSKGKGKDQSTTGGSSSVQVKGDRRGLGKGKGSSKNQPEPVPWAEKVKLAQAKAQSLEQVAAAARRMGSCAAEQLAQEAKDARAKAVEERPLPMRFQRLEERGAAAAAKVEAARRDFVQAESRLEQAEKHLQAVQQELTELQVEMAAAQPAATGMKADALVPAVRELLARLEGPSTTEDVDELVSRVHVLLESRWPTPAGKLDEPLLDSTRPRGRGAKRAADEASDPDGEDWAEPSGGDTTFEPLLALASAAQTSDAELGAMARHALVKHRGNPY